MESAVVRLVDAEEIDSLELLVRVVEQGIEITLEQRAHHEHVDNDSHE